LTRSGAALVSALLQPLLTIEYGLPGTSLAPLPTGLAANKPPGRPSTPAGPYRDLSPKQCDAAAAYLLRENAPEYFPTLVQSGGSLDREEQGLVFGESLPKGLRLNG
jgi:hypothetical protein